MSAWAWILRSRLRTHLVWIAIWGVLTAAWMEFSLYVWTLLGATPLTDSQVPPVFAGIALTTPIANVICALWGAAAASVDIRCGMDIELKVRGLSLLKRTLPQFLVLVLGASLLAGVLCWLSIHASPFLVQSGKQPHHSAIASWLSYWIAVEALSTFLWLCGYYATVITRSQVWGAGLACLVPLLFSLLPMQVSANLPGASLSVWRLRLPLTTVKDMTQLSSILKSHFFIQTNFPFIGVMLSVVCLIVLHTWAVRR